MMGHVNEFMKKLKHLVSFLIVKLKQKQKISQLSNTENNFKFSKGDLVIIKGENISGEIFDFIEPKGYAILLVRNYNSFYFFFSHVF